MATELMALLSLLEQEAQGGGGRALPATGPPGTETSGNGTGPAGGRGMDKVTSRRFSGLRKPKHRQEQAGSESHLVTAPPGRPCTRIAVPATPCVPCTRFQRHPKAMLLQTQTSS